MTILERLRNPVFRELWGCIDKKTPVNAVQATGTLTFSGVVSDGETVTIGTDIYEFDTDSSVTSGNILVDVSGGATANDASAALHAAITASGDGTYTSVDGTGSVTITNVVYGTVGNAVATTETCTNGAWGAATMAGGVNGTAGKKGEFAWDDDYIYVCGTKDMSGTNHYWERTAKASY